MKRKIVLADDHQLLIEGIRNVVLEIDNVEIIAEINTGNELLSFLDKQTADLVLLDLNIPGQDGLKCLKFIKQAYPSTKILVLTSYNQPEIITEVRKLGADGYLNKNSSSAELKNAVNDILEGQLHFTENTTNDVAVNTYFIDDFLKKFQLTRREIDIIRLICKEMSSKQIASELFLSEFTVNTHRKNIFRKLNVKNVAGLLNFAKENNIV